MKTTSQLPWEMTRHNVKVRCHKCTYVHVLAARPGITHKERCFVCGAYFYYLLPNNRAAYSPHRVIPSERKP